MLPRRYIVLLLAMSAAIPVMIGASCPPPAPLVYSVVPNNNTLTLSPVPGCVDGFVCLNLSNGATIPVQIAAYVHSGFDPNDAFPDPPRFACCTNPNSTTLCPCPCPGKTTGDCLLDRTEIFQAVNQRPINGMQIVSLAPNQSVLTRIRCGDIKTVGAAVAQIPGDPIAAPDDRNGPIYRDEPGGVNCGQTIQFLAVDLNQTGGAPPPAAPPGQNLAALILRAQFSR